MGNGEVKSKTKEVTMKGFKKGVKIPGVLAIILLLFVLNGCIGGQNIKKDLTPDEMARASIDYYQRQVKVNMANTEIFLKGNPQYVAKFEAEIAPIFKNLNVEIGNFIQLGKTGVLNADTIEGKLQPILDQIILKLYEVGAKKK
jgi:hypothetical protein